MEPIYQLVYTNHIEELTFEELQSKYTITGYSNRSYVRKEIQDTPVVKGFLGAMFNGFKDTGQVVIRYETQEAYNLQSI
ncbi:hypothetical protein [Virgibacillus halodenitrificans]|uniref:hypothetical protein n=1 Tax=Virgibacillus halodenitrificans TaxID=1482 RepID=UPI000EF4D800|nr:hypothetical protein [Virgibacillus halodenitrificans]